MSATVAITHRETSFDVDRQRAIMQRAIARQSFATLATSSSSNVPHVVGVRYAVVDGAIYVTMFDDSIKARNIRANPRVALNLNSGAGGDDIVRAEGAAEILQEFPPPNEVPEYLEKYRQGMAAVSGDPESFARYYGTALRVQPERWQVW